MGKAKDLSAFERGMVGARRTGLSRTAPLLGFSHHLCIGDGPPPERHPTNLTVGSIGVNVGHNVFYNIRDILSPPKHVFTHSGKSGWTP
jgi:hypothetical protein